MSKGYVLSLCDRTGNMVLPWLEAGYSAITVDRQECANPHPHRRHLAYDIERVRGLLPNEKPLIVFAFPPCTHVAVSGSKHFRAKGLPKLIEALTILNHCKEICEGSGAPWMIENPVSVFSSYWRQPDFYFNPYDYLSFEQNDNYTKKTCLWVGGGFDFPLKDRPWLMDNPPPPPDNRIHKASPSPNRGDFRSVTPMGFARAVFQANAPHLRKAAA